MITKKLKDEIYGWDPNAFKGKGYWFVLGTKGGLGRAASQAEAKKLGKPPLAETIPESPEVYDTVEDTGRSAEYKIKDKLYSEAERVKSTALSDLISEKLMSGESLGKSIKGSISEKTKAKLTGIKEKFDFSKTFDPLNIAKGLGGNLGATLLGRATGRTKEDISYFTGIKPKDDDEEGSSPKTKQTKRKKDPLHTKVSPGKAEPVKRGDAIADVLAKLYNLTKRIDEMETKRMEIQKDFKKEKEEEKQGFLDKLISKLTGKKEEKKSTTTKKVGGGGGAGLGLNIPDIVTSILESMNIPAIVTSILVGLHIGKKEINESARKEFEKDPKKFIAENLPYSIDFEKISEFFFGKEDKPITPEMHAQKLQESDDKRAAALINPAAGETLPSPSEFSKMNSSAPTSPSNEQTQKTIQDRITASPVPKDNVKPDTAQSPQVSTAPASSDGKTMDTDKVSTPIDAPAPVPQPNTEEDEKLQKVSLELDQNQQQGTGSSATVVNAPITNIVNSGGEVLFEKLTGIRTDDSTLKRIHMQNYRWV
jgi:hypothetical protein